MNIFHFFQGGLQRQNAVFDVLREGFHDYAMV
ncbi:hypothetical protein AI2983V1_4395 [Enterobacter cloacae]|nr:hypothetical protein AI2983V1_4395 [Enterobacter cloacae]CAH5726841.1 hypothetical protein AI2983V1_4395 [Enterobacter cloacae]